MAGTDVKVGSNAFDNNVITLYILLARLGITIPESFYLTSGMLQRNHSLRIANTKEMIMIWSSWFDRQIKLDSVSSEEFATQYRAGQMSWNYNHIPPFYCFLEHRP